MGGLVVAFAIGAASQWSLASAQDADPTSIRPSGPSSVSRSTLASKDGVLEVRLIVKQGEARLDTVAKPVQNFLVFAYELIQGTASNGQMSGDNLYPAPTLQVFPRRDADRPCRQRACPVSPSAISTIRNIRPRARRSRSIPIR